MLLSHAEVRYEMVVDANRGKNDSMTCISRQASWKYSFCKEIQIEENGLKQHWINSKKLSIYKLTSKGVQYDTTIYDSDVKWLEAFLYI